MMNYVGIPLLRGGLLHRVGQRSFCKAAVDWALHYRRCALMYRLAPVNAEERFHSRVKVGKGKAIVKAPTKAEYNHAAGALHGSVYFKMLDDSAFFAAQSTNVDNFTVTTSFTTYITRPVDPKTVPYLTAKGTVKSQSTSLIVAESVVYTPDGVEVGRGSGTFMPHPKMLMQRIPLYFSDDFTDEDEVLLE